MVVIAHECVRIKTAVFNKGYIAQNVVWCDSDFDSPRSDVADKADICLRERIMMIEQMLSIWANYAVICECKVMVILITTARLLRSVK